MKKNKKIIIAAILLIAILLMAVGYAVINNVPLKVSGPATGVADQKNFTVEFTGTPEVSNATFATAEIDSADTKNLTAKIDVHGLSAKGDKVTATYTIENKSADLTALLSAETTKNTNAEYFKVTSTLAANSITAITNNSTTVEITVELIKTPVTDNVSSDVEVTITAEPQQP